MKSCNRQEEEGSPFLGQLQFRRYTVLFLATLSLGKFWNSQYTSPVHVYNIPQLKSKFLCHYFLIVTLYFAVYTT